MTDAIDKKLAAIDGRIQARRAEVRARLENRPDLLELAEACKATFGATLAYVRIGDYSTGTVPEWDRWPRVLVSELGEPWKVKRGR